MSERLNKIFKIMSFYDEVRWSNYHNYGSINYYNNDLDDDTKLLTHWLCYITDRQMPFQKVWDVGGFVFSEMVGKFKQVDNLNFLNPEQENSFIVKNDPTIRNEDIAEQEQNAKYCFMSNSATGNNNKLTEDYGLGNNEKVKFIPRYYPADYFSILYTLDILKTNYKSSFTKFICAQLEREQNKNDYLKRLLFSLYLLTYYKIGQPKKNEIGDFDHNIIRVNNRTQEVKDIIQNSNNFEREYQKFKKSDIFKQKRAWCSLRDYLKSPIYKTYFTNSLVQNDYNINRIFSIDSMKQLELPGDVWNNNPKFRKCILKDDTGIDEPKKSINIILRDYFDNNQGSLNGCYPEQFDTTFDFVPRMCLKNNCNICPINKINKIDNNVNDFEKLCVQSENKFCPITFISCNYSCNCFREKCELLNIYRQQ